MPIDPLAFVNEATDFEDLHHFDLVSDVRGF